MGEGAPGLEAKVSGRLFLSNDIGEELPEGSFMGVKACKGGLNMVKLFLRRLSDIVADPRVLLLSTTQSEAMLGNARYRTFEEHHVPHIMKHSNSYMKGCLTSQILTLESSLTDVGENVCFPSVESVGTLLPHHNI